MHARRTSLIKKRITKKAMAALAAVQSNTRQEGLGVLEQKVNNKSLF